MKAIDIILVAILAIAPCTPALADQAPPAASLLYIDQRGWTQANSETKAALAADFMRVFCGNPTMSAADLVNCLERSGDAGSVFTRAMACTAADPAHHVH